jgi:hypothetical protein
VRLITDPELAIIDVLNQFCLPLYDPQTGERFDSRLA